MKYIISLKKISTALICIFLFFPTILDAQKNARPSINVLKTGPYIGIQRGRYSVLELGVERQWKKLKIKNSKTNALHTGFNYNLFENVLGYDIGFWHKEGLLGLTLGGTFSFRSDFNKTRVGFSPIIGYKIWRLHLQTGYFFLTQSSNFNNTNTLFVSLRYLLINDRKFKKRKRKK